MQDCLDDEQLHFNSHPHEEDDIMTGLAKSTIHISTHILTKRMTMQADTQILLLIFQLTSSRRG